MNLVAKPIALVAIATSLTCAVAQPAEDGYESARRATRSALDKQEKGLWNDALAELEQAAQACGQDEAGRSCRLLVQYSQGYLFEKQSRQDSANSNALLASAEQRYLAVLADAPQHEPTLKNLALIYKETGRGADAERLLQRAVEADRSGTGRAAMLLGQIYRDAGNIDAALSSYDRAAATNPADTSAPMAIVALYADGPTEKLPALLPRLAEWAPTLPSVAEEGYRRILVRVPETPTAEQALLPWVALISRQGWISAPRVASLPKGWAPLDDLNRYVQTPEVQPSGSSWWMQRNLRRSVLAQVALAAGQAPEARADPRRALQRFEIGMRFAPQYEDYQFQPELKEAWPTRMELARAMLSLLSRQPTLDPEGRRQRDLINELFAGKAGAYKSDDLVAMQRFHTAIGRWYAEHGEWAGTGITNARFQLESAIGSAEQREKRGEPYQPLQEEKNMLAGGYEKLGESSKARSAYLRAAAAYLDTDQLDLARTALTNSERISSPPLSAEEAAQATVLKQVLATRESLSEEAAPEGFERQPGQRWLASAAQVPFLKRQRFKTLSDLALQSSTPDRAATSARRASAAFTSSLGLDSLVGTADLIRLEKVKTLALAQAYIFDNSTPVGGARPKVEPGAKAWQLHIPSENRPLYVKFSADAVLAGRVAAAVRNDPELTSNVVRYTVDAGTVKAYVPNKDALATVQQQLGRVDGVAAVRASSIF